MNWLETHTLGHAFYLLHSRVILEMSNCGCDDWGDLDESTQKEWERFAELADYSVSDEHKKWLEQQ